jgi:hypothetical protein
MSLVRGWRVRSTIGGWARWACDRARASIPVVTPLPLASACPAVCSQRSPQVTPGSAAAAIVLTRGVSSC